MLNAKETTLAAQKQQAIREAFKDWIWRDPERRQTLVRQYNCLLYTSIRQGMSEVQTVSATVHEIAHSKLHNQKKIQIANDEKYQEIELFDKPGLFSNGRIARDVYKRQKQYHAHLYAEAGRHFGSRIQ